MCVCARARGSVYLWQKVGGVTGEVNCDAVRERKPGWNDVIGNREDGNRLGMREPNHHLSAHTHLLAVTVHAELRAAPQHAHSFRHRLIQIYPMSRRETIRERALNH